MPRLQIPLSTISQSSWWTDSPWFLIGPMWRKVPVPRVFSSPQQTSPLQIPHRGPHGEWSLSSEASSPYPFGSPENEPPSFTFSYQSSRRETERLPPGSPAAPYGEWHPSTELSSAHSLIIHLSLKVPGKWAPPHVPQQVPMERDASSPEPMVYSFIYIRQSPQLRTPPRKTGKTYGRHPRSSTRTEDLHRMGCGLVPQGGHLWHCNLYRSAMQPSAWYLPPWLG